MTEVFKPVSQDQVLEALTWAVAERATLDVVGRGSKRAYGQPVSAAHVLDVSGLSGIGLYEPQELVMSALPGTPLSEIEAALAEQGQQLAFEPQDLGPLLGGESGQGSLGGALACNLSGPRRLQAGAARDHVLGFHAVSGRAEVFKSGGRVVKNVTGFDLSKLMAGSMGTLGVYTELTFKVLPKADKARTVLIFGLNDEAALTALRQAAGSSHEISGAAHLPASAAGRSQVSYVADAGASVTAVRVEGPDVSVAARCQALKDLLSSFGPVEELHTSNTRTLWREIRDVGFFLKLDNHQVWRLSVPPASGASVAAEILETVNGEAFYDWSGGLVWLAVAPAPDAHAGVVRAAVDDGHATLVRGDAVVRANVPVFHPIAPGVAALNAKVKAAFDPYDLLNPGRMGGGA